jgi:group II intron reverse transcriptase/maturase
VGVTKPFDIPKKLVYDAWKAVKANAGSAGVDGETIDDFEKDLENNLYRLWNRMSSGTYFPPPVKAVAIPKKNGGERILGIPTVGDRVAQMAVKLVLEPAVEPIFLPDSYGYRPGKSAHDAIEITRQRCWQYDWVLEFDIKGLFDNINHELLMLAVEKHVESKWAKLYVKRWLTASLQKADGTLVERTQGTPQGGVVSPVLANIFLHYAFDMWMQRTYPNTPWCRYADDGLAHCKTEDEAKSLKDALQIRFAECGLEMHPEKIKIVYCKDTNRTKTHPIVKFDFLGYCFRRRGVLNKRSNKCFSGFGPAASLSALKSMRAKIRSLNLRNRSDMSLQEIAKIVNPILLGWINYYGRFYPSALYPMLRHFNMTMVSWVMHKYLRFKRSRTRAVKFLEGIAEQQPALFAHWRKGMRGQFA